MALRAVFPRAGRVPITGGTRTSGLHPRWAYAADWIEPLSSTSTMRCSFDLFRLEISMIPFPSAPCHSGRRGLLVRLFAGVAMLVPAAAAPAATIEGAVHVWDAAVDQDGDALWQDTGLQADRDWHLSGPQRVAVASATRLTHAYDFDGVGDEAWALAENRAGNHDTTFELWFKPTVLPSGSARPIFEHGNTPRGVTIGLSGDQLVLAYKANPNAAHLAFDLDQDNDGIDNSDFIQAVAVIDDTNDQLRLYVDGSKVQVAPLAASSDFTSNDDLGLGHNAGQGGGGQASTAHDWDAFFDGQIALLREYRWAFTDAEVRQNYHAIAVPEPHSDVVLLLGAALLGWWRRRGQRTC